MREFFKQLIEMWKGKTFIDSVMNDFKKMMNEIFIMFDTVTALLFQHKGLKNIEKKIYEEDIFVNKSERKIRKRIVEHLSIQPRVDIGASLVMMSIVKDVERLGDLCKNIFEVYKLFKKFNSRHKYYKKFNEMQNKIRDIIKVTDIAFRKSLYEEAKKVIDRAYEIEKECDSLIEELAGSKLPTNDAVCLTLLARYFKRIAAHLSNIATSVIFPVHKIDFVLKWKKNN